MLKKQHNRNYVVWNMQIYLHIYYNYNTKPLCLSMILAVFPDFRLNIYKKHFFMDFCNYFVVK